VLEGITIGEAIAVFDGISHAEKVHAATGKWL
jgi:hypothetical protein